MKRSRIASLHLFLIFSVLYVLHAPVANAQNERRYISGNVYYGETSQAAEHVFVDLLTEGGSTIGTATTTSTGSFEFVDLVADTYQLSVHLPDYEPLSVSVDLSFTSSSGNELVLRKRGALVTAPAGKTVSAHLLSMPSKAQGAYAEGNDDLFKKNKPADAISHYEKAVKAAPGFYEAYEALGWAYLGNGRSTDAEEAFRNSIKASGDKYAPADVALGSLLLDTQRLAEAEKVLNQALVLDAESWRALYEMGRAMLMQDKTTEALKDAEAAKSLAPSAPSVYKLLANIHIKLHDNTALLADLDSYVKLDPGSPAGQRAKAIRDQVAKTIPPTAPTPSSQFKNADDSNPRPSLYSQPQPN